jgi:hypothetical protein
MYVRDNFQLGELFREASPALVAGKIMSGGEPPPRGLSNGVASVYRSLANTNGVNRSCACCSTEDEYLIRTVASTGTI